MSGPLLDAIITVRRARMLVRSAALLACGGKGAQRAGVTASMAGAMLLVQDRVQSVMKLQAAQLMAKAGPLNELLRLRVEMEAAMENLQTALKEVYELQAAMADLEGELT